LLFMKERLNKRSKPITKMALYLRAMRVVLWITIPFFVLISLMVLMGDANVQPELRSMLLFVAGNTLGFFAILSIVISPVVLRDIQRIKNQEMYYGFSFNNEMKRLDIRQFVYVDEKWLILVSRIRVYAYRKDFLTDFGVLRKSMLGKKMEAKIMVECADGKARILSGSGATLNAIQDWALG